MKNAWRRVLAYFGYATESADALAKRNDSAVRDRMADLAERRRFNESQKPTHRTCTLDDLHHDMESR